MAENAPIRPQQDMIRTNRETTGGPLMSVIRSLSTSRDLAIRDRERAELEKGFVQCDQKLNDLVAQHKNDIYHVMNIFSKILNNLGRSKEKLHDTREKLQNCQTLLYCKRDKLKKLWLEAEENRMVLDLLERVEQVSSLPKQVDSYISKKYFLHAAQCCVDGLRQLGEDSGSGTVPHGSIKAGSRYIESEHGVLSKIEALTEVRAELLAKKETLFESAIDELHRHLCIISSLDVCKRFHRTGSFRSSNLDNQLETPADQPSRKVSAIDILASNTTDYTKVLQNRSSVDQFKELELSLLFQPYADSNPNFDDYPEEDSRQFISMLIKCFGLLNKIPDAIEVIRNRCDREFIKPAQDVLITSGAGCTIGSNSASATRSNSFLDSSHLPSSGINANENSLHHLFSTAFAGPSAAAATSASNTANSVPVDYSSYFSKRRALAGVMNAMNVMTKNTMTAVVSSATSAAPSDN